MKKSSARIGDEFEKFLTKFLTLKGYHVTRIPDGCKQINSKKIIRKKSPFDFLVTGPDGFAVFFDAKSCAGNSFAFSAINQLQVKELSEIAKNGHLSGYLVWYRLSNVFAFITAQKLKECRLRTSINACEAINLGKELDLKILLGNNGLQ